MSDDSNVSYTDGNPSLPPQSHCKQQTTSPSPLPLSKSRVLLAPPFPLSKFGVVPAPPHLPLSKFGVVPAPPPLPLSKFGVVPAPLPPNSVLSLLLFLSPNSVLSLLLLLFLSPNSVFSFSSSSSLQIRCSPSPPLPLSKFGVLLLLLFLSPNSVFSFSSSLKIRCSPCSSSSSLQILSSLPLSKFYILPAPPPLPLSKFGILLLLLLFKQSDASLSHLRLIAGILFNSDLERRLLGLAWLP